ncbi:MAG: hypothetical protein Q8N83_12235 [Ignavibacteria bacterium]|nr:hypothetical protein [Ignavibacteria bacterium]
MKKIRVYVDTSVFGGVFDEVFRKASSIFFVQVKLNSSEGYQQISIYSPLEVISYE